jgi:hypothetical protein
MAKAVTVVVIVATVTMYAAAYMVSLVLDQLGGRRN